MIFLTASQYIFLTRAFLLIRPVAIIGSYSALLEAKWVRMTSFYFKSHSRILKVLSRTT